LGIMNVLIVGPQGAGKGTQAKNIAEQYGVPHLATGDLYRAQVAQDTELGKLVAPLLREGRLVPDEITIPIVRGEIEAATTGFVLDGYPRNLVQAEALDAMLEEIERPLSIVLLLELDDEVARDRMLRRAETEGRADDTPEAIDRRLATYHDQTEPVVEHYLGTGKLVKVHAERTIEEVWAEIQDVLEAVEARA
jgi:adenylate kinase